MRPEAPSRHARGDLVVVRYADDTVVGFQHHSRDQARLVGALASLANTSAMYSTKERERVVAEFEASDLSAQAFCRKVVISRATLRIWQQDASERREGPRSSSLFARVKIAPSTAVSVPFEVRVEARVVVPPGFDPQHLRAVVEALGACS